MVASTELKRRIDRNLREVAIALADLDQANASWDDDAEMNRITYALEWEDILGRYRMLRIAVSDGDMTPEQIRRLIELAIDFKAAGPLLARLGLARPAEVGDTGLTNGQGRP